MDSEHVESMITEITETIDSGDKEKMLELARTLAEIGTDWMNICFAEIYIRGIKVQENVPKGEKLLREAAKTNTAAMIRLGDYIKIKAIPSPDSDRDSCDWYRRASEAGDPDAEWRYGICLRHAWGTPKDEAAGNKWIIKSGDEGNSQGQYYAGELYLTGSVNVKKDFNTARRYFELSAGQGDPEALTVLGTILMEEGDLERASSCWRKAATSCEEADELLSITENQDD